MRPLMNSSEIDLLRDTVKSVPEFGYIVEWGSGGSTVFIGEHKHSTVSLTSVEHTKRWYEDVSKELRNVPFAEYCFVPPADPDWQEFGTIKEEDPTELTCYISTPGDISNVDLFLVDGVARSSILKRIAHEAKPSALVLLHDAERTNWYEEGTRLYDVVERKDRLACMKLKRVSD